MRRFRKITVDNIEYKWLFRYDDFDYIRDPYILIFMTSNPKATLRITFAMEDHFLLNSGFPALYEGERISINLNQPIFISQIIGHCREWGETFQQTGYKTIDGIKILKEIGYEIDALYLAN